MSAKGLLYFLGGMVLGGGLSYLLLREKYQKESKEAIDEVKEYYKKLEEEIKEKDGKTVTIKAEDVGAEKEGKYTPDTVITTNPYAVVANLYAKKEEVVNYNDISKDDLEDEDEDDEFSGIYPEEPVGHPYVIDEASFVNEKSYYDKLGLFYYQGNNVITNEDGEVVSDWEDLVGPDIGARFRLQDRSDEPFSYIYIRNDSLGCDYEIALRKESFE